MKQISMPEALRLTAYLDGEGVWTNGWGHTRDVVEGQVIDEAQADAWLIEDVDVAETDLDTHVPWLKASPDAVRRGMLNMSFQLGWPRLSLFKAMLLAGSMEDYNGMADEGLNSKWATQVASRAKYVTDLFRSAASGV